MGNMGLRQGDLGLEAVDPYRHIRPLRPWHRVLNQDRLPPGRVCPGLVMQRHNNTSAGDVKLLKSP